MCDTGCLICPRVCGLPNFFSLKRFSTTDGHDSGTRIKLCCKVNTVEGRGTKLCFILSKTWVPLLAATFCFTFSLPILIFQGSLFLKNMFEIALKLIIQIVIIHQHQNKLIMFVSFLGFPKFQFCLINLTFNVHVYVLPSNTVLMFALNKTDLVFSQCLYNAIWV